MAVSPRARSGLSSLSLVFVNLLPLLGVLALGWSVSPIMVLYWSENVVVGFFNVLKMTKARSAPSPEFTINGRPIKKRGPVILFFIVHYSGFTFGHGALVFSLFGFDFPSFGSFAAAFALLFASHCYSYFRHYIGGGEYLRASFTDLFMQPYKRVIVMHITLLVGAGAAQALHSPPVALAVLILLKTGIDLASHRREHRRLSHTTTPPSS